MRKTILLIFTLACTVPVFSQISTFSDAELGFGLETAMPLGDLKETQKTGIGGSVKFGYTIYNTQIAPTFQAGFVSFTGKELSEDQTNLLKDTHKQLFFIPIKIGVRYTFGRGVYAEPQAGGSIVLSENDLGEPNNSSGFTYALNIGFQTLPGIDISARYEAVSFSNSTVAMAGLRIAYHFTFRRQEIY